MGRGQEVKGQTISLVEDLVPLLLREVLQLQRLVGDQGHRQVEVVVPELQRRTEEG